LGGFKNFDFYKKNIQPELFNKLKFLEMLPGGQFDFSTELVSPLFESTYSEESIKKCSLMFYEKYKTYEKTDSYRYEGVNYSLDERAGSLELFLNGFNDYVTGGALERSDNFQSKILGSTIRISDSSGLTRAIKIGDKAMKAGVHSSMKADTTYNISSEMLGALLKGEFIFENIEIGLQSSIEKNKDFHNGHIIRWISRYGYIYWRQHNRELNTK